MLTETVLEGIVVADHEGNIIDWNEGARQMFGYREGKPVHVEVFGTRVEYQGKPAIVGAVVDITDRRRMEREIPQIQEDERRRIGQELHDGIASQLTGITMLSEVLVTNLKEGREIAPEELEEITDLIRETGQQTRRRATSRELPRRSRLL